jgi:hypothetical protein
MTALLGQASSSSRTAGSNQDTPAEVIDYPELLVRDDRTAHSSLGISVGEPDPATETAAWRLLVAGDTLGIAQVETVGMRSC